MMQPLDFGNECVDATTTKMAITTKHHRYNTGPSCKKPDAATKAALTLVVRGKAQDQFPIKLRAKLSGACKSLARL